MEVTTSNIKSTTSKRLSVQVGLTGLSFYWIDEKGREVKKISRFHKISPEELPPKIEAFIASEQIDLNAFNTLQLAHLNNLNTFVPKAFFKEERLPDYLKYNIELQPDDYLVYDIIAGQDMVNVYLPFVNVNNYFIDYFGVFQYHHFSSILLEKAFAEENNHQRQAIYLHIELDCIYLIALKNNKLQLANLFEYQSAEDIMYYLLSCAQSVGFKKDFFLKISGETPGKALEELLDRYVENFQTTSI